MINNIFMDYNSNSFTLINSYITEMEDLIKGKVDIESPYIRGDFEKNIYNFLKDKKLRSSIGEVDEVFKDMSEYFSGATRWHHPYVMNNIKTPVNLVSLAVAFNAMMIDPNLAGDTNCGQIAYAEFEVIKYISDLIGWDWEKSGGYFTFGGTSTLLNGVKFAVDKAFDDVVKKGIHDEGFIISSEQGHSAHADVCNWLGLGKESCIRVPVDINYQMDIKRAEEIISENIEKGKKWIGIIACGGTTIQNIVDPIEQIYLMRKRITKKYNLSYNPHLHVDAVVGWLWLFFKNYSFIENELNMSDDVKIKISRMYKMISQVKYSDSLGIDFHKTGFCPYASSLVLVKDRKDIYDLNNKKFTELEEIEYGSYSPSNYTLELSRSSIGPITALTALKLFGIEGYRMLLSDILEGVNYLIKRLSSISEIEVINPDTNGMCILFVIKPLNSIFNYSDMPFMEENEVVDIALYNYKFYLFLLSKIKKNEVNFFVDYSSGFEKNRSGFHMGILKMQTFNPMLSKKLVKELVNNIMKVKKEYDICGNEYTFNTVYQPKGFKLKYQNKIYELRGDKICLKK